jgi:hypothetical protein
MTKSSTTPIVMLTFSGQAGEQYVLNDSVKKEGSSEIVEEPELKAE